MHFLKNFKHRNQEMHSPKVQRAYHEIRQDMTVGSCILQGISLITLLFGVVLFAMIIFGLITVPIIIADISCVIISFSSYHHFCILMANRMNKKHQK